MLEQRIQQQFFDSADLKYQTAETLSRPVAEACGALIGAVTSGGKLMIGGGGAASALALHFAQRLVGSYERERPPLPAMVLGADAAQQIQALGHPGDVLFWIEPADGDGVAASAAIAAAHDKDMTVAGLTAGTGPAAAAVAGQLAETDVKVAIPHARGGRALELELLVLHCLCDAIDLQLMGELDP
ncbi:phosphoheptose isomerase [Rubrivivax gelatinosus]|uniref:Phosphoheptose isomerase n=1 Tax=Rubrivivax gelatinosus TaxID=28068 RepID=A0ABS1DNP0_RUBGE|nr:SIS domain-containing protein [Rubrivivax gelatinosus]MBK1612643.1 phosphoheptose isomerase [Rubrivivax gelatinosus]MBK1711609.1 phosphoheptose isomerase [Rubrivivax gelatinosus]